MLFKGEKLNSQRWKTVPNQVLKELSRSADSLSFEGAYGLSVVSYFLRRTQFVEMHCSWLIVFPLIISTLTALWHVAYFLITCPFLLCLPWSQRLCSPFHINLNSPVLFVFTLSPAHLWSTDLCTVVWHRPASAGSSAWPLFSSLNTFRSLCVFDLKVDGVSCGSPYTV